MESLIGVRLSPVKCLALCRNLPDWVRRDRWSIWLNRVTAGLDKGDWERCF
jgi:hypothetical protein